MKKVIIYFVLFILFSACQNEEMPADLPDCIIDKIGQLKNKPRQNPPSRVWQYQYRGQTVFYFPPGCCDQLSELYDQNCNLICQPDGGITGLGDGRCADFFDARQNGILVWEDKR